MLEIIEIIPASGFSAVFENVDEERYASLSGVDVFAEVEKSLRILPLVGFAHVACLLPRSERAASEVIGLLIDPTFGDLELCQRPDGQRVNAGRLLGYLPPGGSPELIENYRWITAAHIDSRLVDQEAWQQALEVRRGQGKEPER